MGQSGGLMATVTFLSISALGCFHLTCERARNLLQHISVEFRPDGVSLSVSDHASPGFTVTTPQNIDDQPRVRGFPGGAQLVTNDDLKGYDACRLAP